MGARIAVLARSVGAKVIGCRSPVWDGSSLERDLADFKITIQATRFFVAAARDRGFWQIRASLIRSPHWFWSALPESRWVFAQVFLAAALTNVLGLAARYLSMVV